MQLKTRTKAIIFLCIGLAIVNYLDVYGVARKALLVAENNLVEGHDKRIENNCYVIQNKFNGVLQWGNALYFYMFSIMYLLRNGASVVVLKEVGMFTIPNVARPLGTSLDGVIYGPKADLYNENSECYEWDPLKPYIQQGAMQDIIDLRRDWDTLTATWPKDESKGMNTNPFIADFGITPSLQEVSSTLQVNWEEVLVLHIRQGDVMAVTYPPYHTFVHSQPPCAYYEDVIETGYVDGKAFPYVLIITNTQKEENRKNPCAEYLTERYSSDARPTQILDYDQVLNRLKADNSVDSAYDFVRKDLFILSTAINVAEGASTFTMGTTMFNTDLKRHFVPANPSTINCVWPLSTKLNGDYVLTRQVYSEGMIQTQYLLQGWFDFDTSCNAAATHIIPWRAYLSKLSHDWDYSKENFTTFMLEYPRSLLLKFRTTNKPFECSSTVNPLITANKSKWFAPCMCQEDLIDHILSSE